jgi:hypothetical protein
VEEAEMIDRQHGEIIFECDACDETLETGESAWPHAHALFNAEGWHAEKVGDDWIHTCPKCRRGR